MVGGRVLLWAAVAVVLIRGVVSIVTPSRSSARPVVAAAPAERFPKDAAVAFGARFVHDYLTYDAAHPDQHRQQMTAYLAQGADPMAGWDGRGTQTVSAVIPVGVEVRSPTLGVATIAAQVGGSRWLYLAVPLSTVEDRLVVADLPSLVPAPAAAATAPDLSVQHVDAELSATLRPVVEAFFRAYAAGSGADLAYFAPAGTAPFGGLNGVVALDSVLDLQVSEGATEREARAEVRWADRASGGSVTEVYHLGLVQRDGRWYVSWLGVPPAPVAKEKP